MGKQLEFGVQKSRMTAEQKALLKAYQETGGLLKMHKKKGKRDSDLPLFAKPDNQTSFK